MPPPPSSSALKPGPAPAIVRERTSLFSDLPVPRKNSSLRPPAGDTAAPRAEAPRVEEAPAPVPTVEEAPLAVPSDDDREDLGGFDEIESPTENLTVEKGLRESVADDDLDFIPMSRAPLGQSGAKRAAIAAAALIAALGIAFVVKRAMSPARTVAPSPAPSAAMEGPREPSTPTGDTLEPANDPFLEPSAADPAKGRELRRQARQLLEGGNAEEGVKVSRLAIQADPNDAEGYILLAAGLQDLGRWQESRDVFAKCVQESSRKANAECVYFATRSK
jgi:hypothetical protein